MNQITQQQVKDALIEVAGYFGRPHYEVSVVRDVIASFRSGASHPLKHLVIRELSLLAFSNKPSVQEKTYKAAPKKKKAVEPSAKVLKHGTSTRYLLGCHCEECMEWA